MVLKKLIANTFCFCMSGTAFAEEASILKNAVVDPSDVDPSTVNYLIDDNYFSSI